METETLKLLPAYLIPAALVFWFGLRMLDKRDAANKEIADNFASQVAGLSKDHREQVEGMVGQFQIMQREFAAQQRKVIDDYIGITRETVLAVKGLEMSVRELREIVYRRKGVGEDRRQERPEG